MNIDEILQNAEITSTSVCGSHLNRVAISYDEYDFLTGLTGKNNQYKGYCDDLIEMDYHGEFLPLIGEARVKDKEFHELTTKHGYTKGSLIFTGMNESEVIVMSEEDAEAALEACSSFT